MSDCARGCTNRGQHVTDCLCTNDCPPHGPAHCDGCFPREADVGHYCQRCADKFRDAIKGIPELVTQLAQYPKLATKQTAGDTSRRPTKVDQQSPSPAWDLADEIINWASAWAFIIAGRPTYDPIAYDNAGLPMRDLTSAITHISNRLTQALTDGYHADLWDEATQYHRRLTYATGEDRLIHRLKTRCPGCDQKTLIREDGKDHVECRNKDCAQTWYETDYGWLAKIAAS